jgi:hypothetical protein
LGSDPDRNEIGNAERRARFGAIVQDVKGEFDLEG